MIPNQTVGYPAMVLSEVDVVAVDDELVEVVEFVAVLVPVVLVVVVVVVTAGGIPTFIDSIFEGTESHEAIVDTTA
jgi:hypothetical protein